jgi:hypothetical protein
MLTAIEFGSRFKRCEPVPDLLGFQCHERAARSIDSFKYLAKVFELEYSQLRIYEAAALSRMNRVEEAVASLQDIAASLRSRPDSYPLAQCENALSSAFIAKGDWEAPADTRSRR